MKYCSTCKEDKLLSEFSKNSSRPDGLQHVCKSCNRSYHISYRQSGRLKQVRESKREQIREYDREFRRGEWYQQYSKDYRQREDVKEKHREHNRRHYRENPNRKKQIVDRITHRRRTDPVFRMNHQVSTSVRESLKGQKRGRSWESLVGYTLEELRSHFESLFQPGMSWDNYGEWHIDHKIPVSRFDITSAECEEFRQCWSLENLQPLWAFDNLSKNARTMEEWKGDI
jgi:hypothetical protein